MEEEMIGVSSHKFDIWLKQLQAGFDTAMRHVKEMYVVKPGERIAIRSNQNTVVTIAGEHPIRTGSTFIMREDGLILVADKIGPKEFYCRAIICSRQDIKIPKHLRRDASDLRTQTLPPETAAEPTLRSGLAVVPNMT